MRRGFTTCLILFIAVHVKGQDTLVLINDIQFNSPFEKSVIHDFFSEEKENYLALFMAIQPEMEENTYNRYKDIYQSNLNRIDFEKLNKKKEAKKIKSLYDEVHKLFLKKYELQNEFSSIFSKGYYNCVSASALYGIVFQDFNIPFIIKEKPTHVYVMAYPATEKILVESTDPTGGFFIFNDRYKASFIEQMSKAKLIGSDEIESQSISQLFDQYFFADQEITLRELVGIQYTNDALYKLEKNQLEEAYHQLEKAYLFYPVEKVVSLLIAVNVEILNSHNYKDIKDLEYLGKLSRFSNYGITHDLILGEFGRINNLYLINKGDAETYQKFYEELIPRLENDTLKSEISYLYFYERGRMLYNKGEYKKALSFFGQAYEQKPENQDINNAFVGSISQHLRFESDNYKVILALQELQQKHPRLMENNIFRSMLVSAYLIQCGRLYDLNQPQQAIKYKELFEEHYNSEINVDVGNIGRVYSIAAIYYFRKGNTAKAKGIITQGLKYAPGNYELLVRQQMIR